MNDGVLRPEAGPSPRGGSEETKAVTSHWCERCGGEGKLYTSRYGGNDPDVWPTGTCPACEGTGYESCETEESA